MLPARPCREGTDLLLHHGRFVILLHAQLLLYTLQLLHQQVPALVLTNLLLHSLAYVGLQLAQLYLLLQQQQHCIGPAHKRRSLSLMLAFRSQ